MTGVTRHVITQQQQQQQAQLGLQRKRSTRHRKEFAPHMAPTTSYANKDSEYKLHGPQKYMNGRREWNSNQ